MKKIHPNVKLSPFREVDWEMLNYLPLDKQTDKDTIIEGHNYF